MNLPKVSPDTLDDVQRPMELDLIAYYNLLLEELLKTLDEHSEKSIDDLIHELGKII